MRSLILFQFAEAQGQKPVNAGRFDLCQVSLGADTTNASVNGKFGLCLETESWGLVQAGMTASIPRMRLDQGAWTLDFWYKAKSGWPNPGTGDLITFTHDSGSLKMLQATRSGVNFTVDRALNNVDTRTYANAQADHTHLALVKMGNDVHVYVNGVGTVTYDLATFGLTADEYTSLSIGTGEDIGDIDFYGMISELRFTDAAMYTGDFTPPSSPYND